MAFGEFHFVPIGLGQFIKHGTDSLAWAAPGSPEINNSGFIAFDYLCIKAAVFYFHNTICHDEISFQ
jgi:hypothetical protein